MSGDRVALAFGGPPYPTVERHAVAAPGPTLTGLDELLADVLTGLEARIQRELTDAFGPDILTGA